MGVIKVEVELSADQEKLFEAYMNENCLDPEKWLRRMAYGCIYNAIGRYKQPPGKIAAPFSRQKESVKAKRGKRL
jgi:hypothetical protein